MSLFSTLLVKLSPLYMNMILGFLAGKWLNTPRDTVARFMFYLINPIIMFNGVLLTRIDTSVLSLPVLTFCLSSIMCLLFYRMTKNTWDDTTRNLMAFSAGSGNTGYFGIPLSLILFDTQGVGVYMMAILGNTIFENSIGFYIFAKGSHSPSQCLKKLASVPTIYAFIVGLIFNLLHVPVPEVFNDFMVHIKGTYTVLGMMIIGLGLSGLQGFKLDMKFMGLSFLAKFILWPVIVLGIVFVDATWLGFYSPDIHDALILLSIVPLGINSVILASILHTQPEKAAIAVLVSTVLAIIYVPLMIIYFLGSPGDASIIANT
jgi:malate permease and related proteins